jgi:IclR family transcriptional regulator, KDG regulon repressor
MASTSDDKKVYQVNSLERAFKILRCFSLHKPELSLIEICEMTQLPKPTVFRLLAVMEKERFVARTYEGQRYRVGIRTFELSGIFMANLSLEVVARPAMEALAIGHGMTCNLAILDDGQVVYMAVAEKPGFMRYSPIIGYRHFIHCSALGKAMTANLPEAEVRGYLKKHGMPALSPFTITDPDRLVENLAQVQRQGYALDDQEGAVGVCCLAVPIWDHTQRIVAAMSLSGPSTTFSPELITQISDDMKHHATIISRQLGWLNKPLNF